ncbi:MAG: DUF2125 domain-containing protein [Sulfitobacter sp.]
MMSFHRAYLAPSAVGLSLFATTAYADLTAADVWGNWRSYMEGMGYSVTATEATSGDTLTVGDITVQINGGPEIASIAMRTGSIDFVETGDGAVSIVMPESMPMVIDVTPSGTESPARIALTYTQSGQSMIASGDPDAVAYTQSSDRFGISLSGLEVDGTTFDENAARFSLTGTDITSLTKVSVGETRVYDQDISIGTTTYDLFFKSPDGVEAMKLNANFQDMTFTGTSALPKDGITQMQSLAPMLAAGFAFDGTFTTKATETKMELTSEDGVNKIKSGSASSNATVAMGTEGMTYDVGMTGVQIGAEIAGVPFPLFAEMAQSGFKLHAPLSESDAPQDFSFGFDMTEFTMSDIIWALFDPSGQLPRDPATIALDLSGKAKILSDFLDPEKMEQLALSGETPAELHAVKIDRLTVDAVGAKIDATGDVTFDNTDTTTLPGFPKPVGDIKIDIAGANGLIEKLQTMGLLPAEQVMGARMMMGLFAVAGDSPDTLKSKIEFTDAGQILANGQRLK